MITMTRIVLLLSVVERMLRSRVTASASVLKTRRASLRAIDNWRELFFDAPAAVENSV
jgi:hypothetical protein